MIFSKNRIKHILKSKHKKQSKKKFKKRKKNKKNHNSFRKKKRNLRIQTIKNVKHKKRIAKKKRKAYIHKGGQKLNIIHNFKNNFDHSNKLNKYILPVVYEEEWYENAFIQYGGNVTELEKKIKAEEEKLKNTKEEEEEEKKKIKTNIEMLNVELQKEKEKEKNIVDKTASGSELPPKKEADGAEAKQGATDGADEGVANTTPDLTQEESANMSNHSSKLIKAASEDKTDLEKQQENLEDQLYEKQKQNEEDNIRKEGEKDGIVKGQQIANESSSDSPIGDSPIGDSPESDTPPEDLPKMKYQHFFEIGFLFNESEDIKIKILSDEDVSKTTEKSQNEEQKTEDIKEEKKKNEKRKPKGIKEKLDLDQECNEKMLFTTDPGSIGVWTRPKGKCSPDLKVWGKIAQIIGIS